MSGLEKLEKLLVKGQVSRRVFLARATALGLAATVSPALLKTSVKAAAPQKGGPWREARVSDKGNTTQVDLVYRLEFSGHPDADEWNKSPQ